MTEEEVKKEFELFGTVLATKQRDLEKNSLRRLEHLAYLSAAECTKDQSRGTFETRKCIQSSFDKVEQAQKLLAETQARIGNSIKSCQQKCEDKIGLEAPNGPASLSDKQRSELERNFFGCIIQCPRNVKIKLVWKRLMDRQV